ncbi:MULTISPECIES: sensor histidine kinase KdpD [Pseudomonadota]|jgi:two-component system sensor histidine kinase KdpD|uniref:sensor histidine kinase n=1 Tax=Pseudomonadota TaxID=1224 RepID=UPI00076A03CF|nr:MULTISPECIES: sensor histidine kinase KdpD [Pseudomonadota]MAF60031.1 sensor histidine kinase KdpD [Blastomonas sp.]|tara:strand:+ start:52479 stop:55127 length:2649 start_codon:yes stop_codon:yes gene_type:complete
MTDSSPSNDAERYLRIAKAEQRGRLTVYLGAAPGGGKTYRMLQEAARRRAEGEDVVVGVAETHGRGETAALLAPFEILPRRAVDHQGHRLEEFDLDAALARRPGLILVDELAHTNAPGSRHPKRWQDVAELLAEGIDVASTVNIQHIESLNDLVAGFTHVRVRETIPDSFLEDAELIVVDLPPEALIERLRAGKVYLPDTAGRALANFFTPNKLAALRELALRFAAHNVDRRLSSQLELSGERADFVSGERLLVAVSPGRGGARVVRHAKRLADLLHAPWTAVVVESAGARAVSGSQREQLADNLALAASLGASLMTIAAQDVGQALVDQAKDLRASQIVIGKSRRSRWFEWRHGSIVQDVIRRARSIPVHVVPLDEADEKPLRPYDPYDQRDNVIAFVSIGAVVGLLFLLKDWIAPGAIDMLLLVPVTVSAMFLRMRAALWAALWAALAYNFFFIPPLYTLSISSPSDVVTFIVLAGVAAVIGVLAGKVRQQAQISAGVARLNASLARFAGLMGALSDRDETANVACREIGMLLDVEAVIVSLEDGNVVVRGNPTFAELDMVDETAARWALEHGQAAGRDTGTLASADWQFHPLKTALGTMGALGVARSSKERVIRPDDATLLASLVDQTALAHERLVLEAEARQVEGLRERDRLRGALLGSIAHDLRTPLTAVIAATEAIPAEGAYADEVRIARSETRRLQRFLNDLLEASRIEDGSIEPRWESLDLTDIIHAVLRDLRQDRPGSRVVASIDPDCPIIQSDPLLLRHVLINLIDNALKFSPAGSRVDVELLCGPDAALCRVADRGPGLPADRDGLFDRFHRLEGSDRVGGSGLGLWIAKNFIEAVRGSITASNREGGGAVFEISLPLTAPAPEQDHEQNA